MTEQEWAKFKTEEVVFFSLLKLVPVEERASYLAGMQATISQVEDAKKSRESTKHPQK